MLVQKVNGIRRYSKKTRIYEIGPLPAQLTFGIGIFINFKRIYE